MFNSIFRGILASLFLFASKAFSCDVLGISERLQAACVVNEYNKSGTPASIKKLFSLIPKLGLQLAETTNYPKYWYSYGLSPYLSYDNNFNGGNPDKPLIVNNLAFEGQVDSIKKDAVAVGIWGDFRGRLFWGGERGIGLYISGSKDFAPELNLSKSTKIFKVCSENHLHAGIYFDVCRQYSGVYRDLQNTQLSSSYAVGEYVKPIIDNKVLLSTEFKKDWVNREGVSYEILSLKETILTQSFNAYWAKIGWSNGSEANRLDLRHSLQIGASTRAFDRRVSLSMSQAFYDGLKIFGTPVVQDSSLVEFRTDFVGTSHLIVGFNRLRSNLSYYDDNQFSIRVESGF